MANQLQPSSASTASTTQQPSMKQSGTRIASSSGPGQAGTSSREYYLKAERFLTTKDFLLPSSLEGRPKIRKPKLRGIYLSDPREHPYEPYEPYENRVVSHPTSNCETILHLLKGSLGTGILAMPRAFHNAGYVVGSIGTILIGILCTYTIHILLDSCYTICKRRKMPSLTYTGAAEAALAEGPHMLRAYAPYAATTVNVFLVFYQVGVCCVYVVFIAENINFVLTKQFQIPCTVHYVMYCEILPVILINYVRDLKYLAPFSAIANIVTFCTFGIILYYIFREPITAADKSPTGNFLRYPLFFGTVMFALEAIGVILPLENEMKTPRAFSDRFGVLNLSMAFIIFLFTGMGMAGYFCYGSEALGSITLNLPAGKEMLASCVQILLSFSIFVSYPLQMYVAIDILWTDYIGGYLLKSKLRRFWEYVLRTTIVLFTFALAAAVPELDLFISLFGALCLSALGFAFPAIIQTCTYWHYVQGAPRVRMTIKNTSLVILGIFGLVVGSYTSLQGIIEKFL